MNNDQKDILTNKFISQFKILNDLNQTLDCDLCVCFEEDEEEIQKIKDKIKKLKKIRKELVKIYSQIISEF